MGNAFMSTTRPSVFTKSNMEGVERVQRANGAYAFMMEATSIEFFIERKCDVMKIGGMLDSKGYGIAMRPGLHFETENEMVEERTRRRSLRGRVKIEFQFSRVGH